MDSHTLKRLSDEAECRALLSRYGQAVDWRDRAALDLMFWPDAAVDLGFFKGRGDAAPAFLMENAERSLRRCHITTNVTLRLDGDVASADSCAITHAVSRAEGEILVSHLFFGRYVDRLERRGGEWRFAARDYLLQATFSEPYKEDEVLGALATTDGLGGGHGRFGAVFGALAAAN